MSLAFKHYSQRTLFSVTIYPRYFSVEEKMYLKKFTGFFRHEIISGVLPSCRKGEWNITFNKYRLVGHQMKVVGGNSFEPCVFVNCSGGCEFRTSVLRYVLIMLRLASISATNRITTFCTSSIILWLVSF